MADARMLHKKGSHGQRVIALDHLEFRVWVQYVLSADDFGVMRASQSVLRADNPRLERETVKRLDKAMECVVASGLIQTFTHQDSLFWWQDDWQDFQKVRYPRESINPLPTDDVIGLATAKTWELFRIRADSSRSDFCSISEMPPTPTRAGGRETLTPTQAGSRSTDRKDLDLHTASFERFWERYPRHVKKQDALKAWQKLAPDAELIAKIHAALDWQLGQRDWTKNNGEFVPYPATYLNARRWTDEAFNAVDESEESLRRVLAGQGRLQ